MADSSERTHGSRAPRVVVPDAIVEAFDEEAYLRDYPDVVEAIARGDVPSALVHYKRVGRREGRRLSAGAKEPKGVLVRTPSAGEAGVDTVEFRHSIEAVILSATGGIAILGWVDDQADPLDVVRIHADGWRFAFDADQLIRTARGDVEAELHVPRIHAFGFFAFAYVGTPLPRGRKFQVEARLKSGRVAFADAAPRVVEDAEIRNVMLLMLHSAQYLGNPQVCAINALARGAGAEILKLNTAVTDSLIAAPHIVRFGPPRSSFDASLIVCLYGKPEFLQLQAALYGGLPGIQNYELVYVSNSPEISEVLLREAKASAMIYGLNITLVLLSGNAGFGAANNVAVAAARSSRILIVNPDVFPINNDWARRHTALVEEVVPEKTRIFGSPLYYDDGSLMHSGMYFEFDVNISFENKLQESVELIRVEHYGKGAPGDYRDFLRSRPVPAVSGAFMSCNRSWYERLGGFTQDYVFGHYEDADLSLKSLLAGAPVYIHDLRAWHLEGKGSTRLPVHEGGSLVNRWLFAEKWGDRLRELELIGPQARVSEPSSVPELMGSATYEAAARAT